MYVACEGNEPFHLRTNILVYDYKLSH